MRIKSFFYVLLYLFSLCLQANSLKEREEISLEEREHQSALSLSSAFSIDFPRLPHRPSPLCASYFGNLDDDIDNGYFDEGIVFGNPHPHRPIPDGEMNDLRAHSFPALPQEGFYPPLMGEKRGDPTIEREKEGSLFVSESPKLSPISPMLCFDKLPLFSLSTPSFYGAPLVSSKRKKIKPKPSALKKKIASSFQLQRAKKKRREKGGISKEKRKKGEQKMYPCSYCERVFKNSGNCKRHERVHTGERPFPCRYCPKAFKTDGNRKKHERIHTGEKPYACRHCGKKFSQSSGLTSHLTLHTGERAHRCPHCNKGFTNRGNLSYHIKTHTKEKPFPCSHCRKSFILKSSLEEHMRLHTGERPYRCSDCPKAFARKSALKKHRRVHTGEKPYVCKHCQQRFACSSNRTKHVRKHENPG